MVIVTDIITIDIIISVTITIMIIIAITTLHGTIIHNLTYWLMDIVLCFTCITYFHRNYTLYPISNLVCEKTLFVVFGLNSFASWAAPMAECDKQLHAQCSPYIYSTRFPHQKSWCVYPINPVAFSSTDHWPDSVQSRKLVLHYDGNPS